MIFTCSGCNKIYKTDSNLIKHIKNSKECSEWINILKNSYNKNLAKKIDDLHTDDDYDVRKLECIACDSTFCNIGNYNKHFKNRKVCRKIVDWKKYNFNSKLENKFRKSKRVIKKIDKLII